MTTNKKSLFVGADGKSLVVTFTLVSSLFLLWGFCNGMIDVMDKHFQQELHLTLAQSAWVQFAHYLGYFLMAIPAGWLATKLGYKGGIIAGLLMVAAGGLWFVPATKIAAFWAFLFGVCLIAAGLTFLETIANPYTTVLGPKEFAATRINLAQSCNGIGWIFGPIAGSLFFYGKDASGNSTGSQTLWIPYVGVAVVVIVLAVVFYFANVPDIKSEDTYHLDDKGTAGTEGTAAAVPNKGLALFLLWANVAVLSASIGMLGTAIASIFTSDSSITLGVFFVVTLVGAVIGGLALVLKAKSIHQHSIWVHPHFSGATLAQFFYVAAQAGIFSFLINYMTSQLPTIPESWNTGWLQGWFEPNKQGVLVLTDAKGATLASVGFFCFLAGRFSGAGLLKKFPAHKVLGLYGLVNVVICLLIFLKLGWVSVFCVFLSYFFMSIMFPTIFALGIHGLGGRAKKASSYIVMAIMGGAILPKLMGAVGDKYDISRGFIVPLVCFGAVALYGYAWPKLSQADSLNGGVKLSSH